MSEFRQDISGEWVIMAPGRAKRAHEMLKTGKKRLRTAKSYCPFEDLKKSGNWPPVAVYPKTGAWQAALIPNKYPTLIHSAACTYPQRRGVYEVMNGAGHHELLVTRDHDCNFPRLSAARAGRVLTIFQERCRTLSADRCIRYGFVFANWGPGAGASVYHPHYQLLALPFVPPEVRHSLVASEKFFHSRKRCVHCEMLAYEKKIKARIVKENSRAVAIAPFPSRRPFEVRVFPKNHYAFFESAAPRDTIAVAAVAQSVLRKITKRLQDPDWNFYIHTAPLKDQSEYSHYHWHMEILPNLPYISVIAGFELGTGIFVNVIDPERTAAFLNGKKI